MTTVMYERHELLLVTQLYGLSPVTALAAVGRAAFRAYVLLVAETFGSKVDASALVVGVAPAGFRRRASWVRIKPSFHRHFHALSRRIRGRWDGVFLLSLRLPLAWSAWGVLPLTWSARGVLSPTPC